MPTRVSAAADLERELLTAEDFLEWLEPGTCADLIDGDYRRDGELLVEYAEGAAKIESLVVPGFFVMREWLNPGRTPRITESLARTEA